MPETAQQPTSAQYKQALDSLHVLAGMLLFEFARHNQTANNRGGVRKYETNPPRPTNSNKTGTGPSG